jgi:hypothetical protein
MHAGRVYELQVETAKPATAEILRHPKFTGWIANRAGCGLFQNDEAASDALLACDPSAGEAATLAALKGATFSANGPPRSGARIIDLPALVEWRGIHLPRRPWHRCLKNFIPLSKCRNARKSPQVNRRKN